MTPADAPSRLPMSLGSFSTGGVRIGTLTPGRAELPLPAGAGYHQLHGCMAVMQLTGSPKQRKGDGWLTPIINLTGWTLGGTALACLREFAERKPRREEHCACG